MPAEREASGKQVGRMNNPRVQPHEPALKVNLEIDPPAQSDRQLSVFECPESGIEACKPEHAFLAG